MEQLRGQGCQLPALTRKNEGCLYNKQPYLPKHRREDVNRNDKAGVPLSCCTYKSTA